MKKVLLVIAICVAACMLFACGKDDTKQNPSSVQSNNGSDVGQDEKEFGVVEYDTPDFTKSAGYEVVKSKELSSVSYDTIFLLDGENSQLDLKLDDGRIATLLISKSERFIDEDAQTKSIVGFDVAFIKGTDGINTYTWNKDNNSYMLSVLDEQNFTDADVAKIIEGFSVKAGENY